MQITSLKKLNTTLLVEILNGEYIDAENFMAEFHQKKSHSDELEIFISGKTFDEEVIIEKDFICSYNVKIENCVFSKELSFMQGTFEKHISLSRNNFNDRVTFGYKINLAYLSIYKAIFKNGIYFGSGNFKSVRLGNNKVKEVFVFGGRYKSFSIDGPGVEEIQIHNSGTFIGNLGIGNNNVNTKVRIGFITVNKLYIHGKYDMVDSIRINNVNLHSLVFGTYLSNSKRLSIHDISIHQKEKEISNVKIRDFFNTLSESELKTILDDQKEALNLENDLYELNFLMNHNELWAKKEKMLLTDSNSTKKSKLEFNKVQVGPLELKNINLNDFENIIIRDTDLSQLKTFNSSFPIGKITGNNHSLYEIFNDLYSSAKNKNNKREQIEYYTASKNALLRSFCDKNWFKKIPSILSLSLTKLYSNFGTRWPQSLILVTPIVGFLFFSFMLLSTTHNIDFSEKGLSTFKDLTVYFIQYLNPTHKLEFMDGKLNEIIYSQSAFFVFFDLVGRIFIGIGIYETILSFRKYVRN